MPAQLGTFCQICLESSFDIAFCQTCGEYICERHTAFTICDTLPQNSVDIISECTICFDSVTVSTPPPKAKSD